MTRLEQKKLKLIKEEKLIKSLKHHKISSEEKSKFRSTSFWKQFRKDLIEKQKTDPLTESKLTKTANCHHLNLNPLYYTELKTENFLMLNPMSHDTLHFLYSQMCKDKNFIPRLMTILQKMYKLNNGKDIKDFK